MPVYITDSDLLEKFERIEGRTFQDHALIRAFQDACIRANVAQTGDFQAMYDVLTESRVVIYGAMGVHRYIVDPGNGEVTFEESHGSPRGLEKAHAEGFRGSREKRLADKASDTQVPSIRDR